MKERLSETDTKLLLTFFTQAGFNPIPGKSARDADGWEDIDIQRGSYGGKDDCMRLARAGFLELSEDETKVRLTQTEREYVLQTNL